MLAAAPFSGLGAPFVAAAGALLELISSASALYSGCGVTCVDATNIVNQVEPLLQQNMQLYFTNPNRTTCDQQAAINTFNSIQALVTQGCNAPPLNGTTAGKNCISDRYSRTSCAFGKTTANEYPPYASVPYPVGVCWNWLVAYYDPIVNDVPPGGDCGVNILDGSSTSSSSMLPLLLGVAAVVLLLMVVD
jgi:hypothetical protein